MVPANSAAKLRFSSGRLAEPVILKLELK